MDLVRSTTDGRYVYVRNHFLHVSQAQRVAYQFETPSTRVWYQLFSEGQTNVDRSIFWQIPKAPEELYDFEADRDEVKNLASSPEHRAVRWWAAMGLLMRGGDAVTKHVAELEKSLGDASPAVRIAAAQALGGFGDAAALGKALSTLGELAPPERNGVLVSMSALSAIEVLAAKAAPLHATIASMKPGGASPDRRYDEYVTRLMGIAGPKGRFTAQSPEPVGVGIPHDPT